MMKPLPGVVPRKQVREDMSDVLRVAQFRLLYADVQSGVDGRLLFCWLTGCQLDSAALNLELRLLQPVEEGAKGAASRTSY